MKRRREAIEGQHRVRDVLLCEAGLRALALQVSKPTDSISYTPAYTVAESELTDLLRHRSIGIIVRRFSNYFSPAISFVYSSSAEPRGGALGSLYVNITTPDRADAIREFLDVIESKGWYEDLVPIGKLDFDDLKKLYGVKVGPSGASSVIEPAPLPTAIALGTEQEEATKAFFSYVYSHIPSAVNEGLEVVKIPGSAIETMRRHCRMVFGKEIESVFPYMHMRRGTSFIIVDVAMVKSMLERVFSAKDIEPIHGRAVFTMEKAPEDSIRLLQERCRIDDILTLPGGRDGLTRLVQLFNQKYGRENITTRTSCRTVAVPVGEVEGIILPTFVFRLRGAGELYLWATSSLLNALNLILGIRPPVPVLSVEDIIGSESAGVSALPDESDSDQDLAGPAVDALLTDSTTTRTVSDHARQA